MTENPPEVLSAFVDGEAVKAAELAAALATPRGRETLIELLLLREAVRADPSGPPAAWTVEARRRLRWKSNRVRWAGGAAAAALAVAAVLGVWSFDDRARDRTGPPRPTRTLGFECASEWRCLE